MIHLKCAVVYYANLNSRSINKHYSPPVPYPLSVFVFSFLLMLIWTKHFCQKLHEKISFFKTNLQNVSQDVLYYRILEYENDATGLESTAT